MSIDSNVTFRVDAVDGTPDQVGFTVLSSKNSELYYSNNWVLNDSTPAAWITVVQQTASGGVAIN